MRRSAFLIIPVVLVLVLSDTRSIRARNKNNSCFKDTVVGISRVDQGRVNAIAEILNDDPKGFGDPCNDRKNWDLLKASGRYGKVLNEADKISEEGLPVWDEALYMGFFTKGDSQSGKDMQANRMRAFVQLVWAECIDNRGKYVPAIEKALQALITQKTWVHPRNFNQKNFDGLVELSTASYAQNIAQAIYLLQDKLSPSIREQAIAALYQRAFNPLLKTIQTNNDDHGWLTGTNNWNAVCLSGVTGAALTVIRDKKERATFVAIAERYIKNFVAGFPADGYCTEGLSYFNYGFGRYITLREIVLQATSGKLDLFSENPTINKIAWFLPNMEIINGVYPAIGDCKQFAQPSSSILQYVSKTFGMGLSDYEKANLQGRTNDLQEDLMSVFPNSASAAALTQHNGQQGTALRGFFDVAGVLTVRPAEAHPHAMGATLKGGNNNEHHNHNDLGSFTIVVGNEILIGDPGSIPYTAKTFSPQRYEYKTLGSYGHPVPLIGGMQQRPGAEARASILAASFADKKDVFSMDIASAYGVPGIKKMIRTFTYSRGRTESLQMNDAFGFAAPQIFESALITRCKWKKIAANQLMIEGEKEKLVVTITSQEGPFSIESEVISEEKGAPYTRLALRLNHPVKSGEFVMEFSPVNQ